MTYKLMVTTVYTVTTITSQVPNNASLYVGIIEFDDYGSATKAYENIKLQNGDRNCLPGVSIMATKLNF